MAMMLIGLGTGVAVGIKEGEEVLLGTGVLVAMFVPVTLTGLGGIGVEDPCCALQAEIKKDNTNMSIKVFLIGQSF